MAIVPCFALLFALSFPCCKDKTIEYNKQVILLQLLTGIPNDEIPAALDLALKKIGVLMTADRAYIFELNQAGNSLSNTYEWCNNGIHPEIENLQDIPCDLLPMWLEKIQFHENIIIPDVGKLPEAWSAEREILERQGIQSLIVVPMMIDNNLMGFAGLDSVAGKRTYSASEANILRVWSNMLASLISHRRKTTIIEQTHLNYETFFNTIDDFLFVLDTQANMIHVNSTVTKRLGYTTEELLGKSVLMVHPVERREEAGRIVGEMLAGTAEFCPVPLVTKSGDYISVETKVKAGFWNGIPAIFGVTKDVSKIKLSEEKFSKAFQSNSTLMAISTFDGTFIEVNETFLKTLGYSREEVIGNTSSGLNLFIDRHLRTLISEKILMNIPVREVESEVLTKSGKKKTGLFSVDSIYIGKDLCLLTMMVDITERKLAEKEIVAARNEAEKANHAKSEFLSRMSHELRTPMNSILGFSQLLNMGELNPKQKKQVSQILNSGKHLLNLIDEVLDISRIEAGKLSLLSEPIQLNTIIAEIIESVQPLAHSHQVKLELKNSPASLLYLITDRKRLKQVLINLLSNAVKYNRKGGRVWVTAELVPQNNEAVASVRISVTDTGFGVPSDDIPKLFVPFERVGAEKTRTEGTGLGLAVVKKIIDAMKGTVGVESIVGTGSTFWIELPVAESNKNLQNQKIDDQYPANQTAKNLNNDTQAFSKTGTILYIEDNILNAALIAEIIENHRPGITLVTSIYGNTAVKLASENQADLILLDLDLPDMEGNAVLQNILADDKTKSIPVVIISADATQHQIEKLMITGAKDYLTKPLDIPMFLQVVDEWIGI